MFLIIPPDLTNLTA